MQFRLRELQGMALLREGSFISQLAPTPRSDRITSDKKVPVSLVYLCRSITRHDSSAEQATSKRCDGLPAFPTTKFGAKLAGNRRLFW
jgi:hypothetical protein